MQRKAFWPTAARYYVLWVFQLAGSVLGTWALCATFGTNELLAKYAVDIPVSYTHLWRATCFWGLPTAC